MTAEPLAPHLELEEARRAVADLAADEDTLAALLERHTATAEAARRGLATGAATLEALTLAEGQRAAVASALGQHRADLAATRERLARLESEAEDARLEATLRASAERHRALGLEHAAALDELEALLARGVARVLALAQDAEAAREEAYRAALALVTRQAGPAPADPYRSHPHVRRLAELLEWAGLPPSSPSPWTHDEGRHPNLARLAYRTRGGV